MNVNEVTSKQVLPWAKQIEAQRSHKAMLDNLNDNKEFYTVSKTICRREPDQYVGKLTGSPQERNTHHLRYCGMIHQQR